MLAQILLVVAAMSLVVAYEFDFVSVKHRGGVVLLIIVFFCFMWLALLLGSAI